MTTAKLVVAVAVAFATNAASSSSSSKVQLPKIPYETLKTHLENNHDELVERLKDVGGKVGVFAITELPKSYEMALRTLMVEARRCLVKTGRLDLPPTVPMPDGSTRTTYATESGKFPSCLNMAHLVEVFDRVETMVATLIEKVHEKQLSYVTADGRDARGVHGGQQLTYVTVDARNKSEVLGGKQLRYVTADAAEVGLKDFPVKDHVHVYEKAAAVPESSSSDMMVPYHVDNGMFLIITPFPNHGLDVGFSDGSTGSTEDVDSRSVLVLMGRGLTEWLFQEGGYPDAQQLNQLFHPVPHAVKSMKGIPTTRVVYARMKVAPGTALPASLTQKVGTNRVKPLKSFREVFMERGEPGKEGLGTVKLSPSPVSSSPVNNDWFLAMDALCHHGSAYCWMSCMQLPDSCPNTELANCSNNKSGLNCRTDVEGEVMDPGCRWQCNNNNNDIANSSNDFCNGGTDMHMMGFEVAGGDRSNLCVILFIPAWTLDSRLKFGVACLGVLLLGMSIEGLVFLRRCFNRKMQRRIIAPYLLAPNLLRRGAAMLMFGLNIFLGYLAMLVAMTYSVELFCCVLLGLVIGHAVFNVKAAVGESVDPCCAPSNQNIDGGGTTNLLFDNSSPAGLLPCTRTPNEAAGAASISILRPPSGSNPPSPNTSPKCHRSGDFQ